MYRGVHILGLVLLTVGMLIPSNGCGGNNSSSIKKFNCRSSKMLYQTVPGTPNILLRTTNCDDYTFDKNKISKVIHHFVEDYSRVFGIPEETLWRYFTDLEIEVSAIPRVVGAAFDVKGNPVKDAPVTGLALTPKKIWVEVKTSQIWSSSLIHELVHIVIWNQNMGIHADPDHEGKEFSGWTKGHTTFIRILNRYLFDQDI